MLLRKVLVALAFCFGIGSAQASPVPSLPDLNLVPTAYMRHHGHHYGRHHVTYRRVYRRYAYRPVQIVRYHRPYRYGYYRRVHRPYRYSYYRRTYRPYYGYGYAPGYYRPHRSLSISVGF
jgi:hypothetical protein